MSPNPQHSPLTAAEALVLQNPQLNQGRAALKLTLMELLARRIVTMRRDERKGMFGRTQHTDYLELAPDAAQRIPDVAHVRSVIEMIRAADKKGYDATMLEVISQARKTFGADLAAYHSKHVVPNLIGRGLIEAYQAKRLGIFTTTKYRHTAQGETVRQQLAAHLEQARALPKTIERNPAQAAALVATLGGSILLVDELKPYYGRLSQAMRPGGGDAGVYIGDDDDSDNDDSSSLDSSDFGFGDFGSFDFDFNTFHTLDTSMDAFDSSFDSSADSGSDGGSDGGGSD